MSDAVREYLEAARVANEAMERYMSACDKLTDEERFLYASFSNVRPAKDCGVESIVGKWPRDETDEQVAKALKNL